VRYAEFDAPFVLTSIQDVHQIKPRQSLRYGRLIQLMTSRRNLVSRGRGREAPQKVSARACSMIAWKSFADMVLWTTSSRNASALVDS
jgi:hypothetical protein